ncbi:MULTISPECIES: metal-dependent hydrolase [Turicibacter]|uniref:metal-dependent hydrolase n=1 Tax=Turicibacter TaxID=191303 RepID=UPI000762F975|nr:metal-dependent hydrolase [Turicibacter sp. H121]AMC09073.1 hydrolase [Turicibacter sp. H121]MCU7198870.1 metal-dependent hydrolase [Turicibacter sp. H121]
MTAATHQRGGLLCGLITHQLFIAPIYAEANTFSKLFIITLYCVATTVGSLLPDIDMKSSQMGKLLPFISKFISAHFKHRTLTHSLLSIAFFFILMSFAPLLNIGQDFYIILTCGLMVGHISHIVLDLFTHQGVCLFYPCKIKIKLANFKTGAKGERFVNSALLVSMVLYFLYETYTVMVYAFHP